MGCWRYIEGADVVRLRMEYMRGSGIRAVAAFKGFVSDL